MVLKITRDLMAKRDYTRLEWLNTTDVDKKSWAIHLKEAQNQLTSVIQFWLSNRIKGWEEA